MTIYDQNGNVEKFGFIDEDDEFAYEVDDTGKVVEIEQDVEEIPPGKFQLYQQKFIDAYNKLEAQKYKVDKMPVDVQKEWVALIDKGQQLKYNINRINNFLNLRTLDGLNSLSNLGIAPVVLVPVALGGLLTIGLIAKFVNDVTLNVARYKTSTAIRKELISKGVDPITAAKKAKVLTDKQYPPDYGLFGGLFQKLKWPLIIITAVIVGPKLYRMVKNGR